MQTWTYKQKWALLKQLSFRDIETRYRGSALGFVWAVATPIINLAVFTFVFGTLFQSRWAGADANASPYEFAVILFIGLTLFQLLGDVINRAPGLIRSQPGYVTKVKFPLEILPITIVGSALFNALLGFLITVPFIYIVFGDIPVTIIFFPVIITPFIILVAGFGWLLSALGVYIRDVLQIMPSLSTALLFLSPIFFPLSSMPDWILPIVYLNPLTFPVDQLRDAVIFGVLPEWKSLAIYTAVACSVAGLGYVFFQNTRSGFADVI